MNDYARLFLLLAITCSACGPDISPCSAICKFDTQSGLYYEDYTDEDNRPCGVKVFYCDTDEICDRTAPSPAACQEKSILPSPNMYLDCSINEQQDCPTGFECYETPQGTKCSYHCDRSEFDWCPAGYYCGADGGDDRMVAEVGICLKEQ